MYFRGDYDASIAPTINTGLMSPHQEQMSFYEGNKT